MNRYWRQRRAIALLVLAALLLISSGCAGGISAASWTGLNIVEDVIYLADLDRVRAMDPTSGATLWSFPTDPKDNRGAFYVTPAVGDEVVVVASQTIAAGFFSQAQHIVWALDRETGRELWQFAGAAGPYIEGGALSGDLFVIGSSDGNVYALDAGSGVLRWVHETGHRVWATPLIVSDLVYIGSMDRHVYALNLSDGQVRWDFEAEGAFAGTPVLRDGTLYVGAFDDRLYAIDAETGTERWRFSAANWIWGSPTIYGDTIYAADVNGNVYAVAADTGTQVWLQALVEAPVRAGLAVTEDGSRLFVSSQNGQLYALDLEDGFVLWAKEGGGQMLSRPVVVGSVVYNTVIYGSRRVQALYVDNGRELWVYPPPEVE